MINHEHLVSFHAMFAGVEAAHQECEKVAMRLQRAHLRAIETRRLLPRWRRLITFRPRAPNVTPLIVAAKNYEMWITVSHVLIALLDDHLGLNRGVAKTASPRVEDTGGIYSLTGMREFDARRRNLVFPFAFDYPPPRVDEVQLAA